MNDKIKSEITLSNGEKIYIVDFEPKYTEAAQYLQDQVLDLSDMGMRAFVLVWLDDDGNAEEVVFYDNQSENHALYRGLELGKSVLDLEIDDDVDWDEDND